MTSSSSSLAQFLTSQPRLNATVVTSEGVSGACHWTTTILSVEGFQVSGIMPINSTFLQVTVADLLTVNITTVSVCLVPVDQLITTVYLGSQTTVESFSVVTVNLENGNLTSQLGVILTQSPTVIVYTPPSITGDPQFVGLLGQSYQVHGIDGAVYALISEPAMQLNARFRFLTGPRQCPVMPSTGRTSKACWSHEGSYLSELGLMTKATGEKVQVIAGSAQQGFESVSVNGQQLAVGESTASNAVSRQSSHELVLRAGSFVVEVESVDGFVNLRSVTATVAKSQLASHGLLGQTWSTRRHQSTLKVIEGEVDDYVVAEDHVFGKLFMYNQYELDSQ